MRRKDPSLSWVAPAAGSPDTEHLRQRSPGVFALSADKHISPIATLSDTGNPDSLAFQRGSPGILEAFLIRLGWPRHPVGVTFNNYILPLPCKQLLLEDRAHSWPKESLSVNPIPVESPDKTLSKHLTDTRKPCFCLFLLLHHRGFEVRMPLGITTSYMCALHILFLSNKALAVKLTAWVQPPGPTY